MQSSLVYGFYNEHTYHHVSIKKTLAQNAMLNPGLDPETENRH